ncbi:hypothetical protein BC834DRAFT_581038 [Gloeopeniophorella convolvens]|nr:hypothetical protein BC834DRAFT_581038 [Gloeopeniophorella convolvens]
MIQICPPEILCHIFHHACVDGGFTARSLSLTSRYISSVSSRFLFRTLCLLGVDHIEHAVSRLSSLSPELRHVYHVFVTDNSSWVGSKRHPVRFQPSLRDSRKRVKLALHYTRSDRLRSSHPRSSPSSCS